MDSFEAKLSLSSILKRNPVIYIEYNFQEGFSIGKYYTFNKAENLYEITYDIACVLDMYNEYYIVPAFNWRTKKADMCFRTQHPQTAIRNLSRELFMRWDAIEFFLLAEEHGKKGER